MRAAYMSLPVPPVRSAFTGFSRRGTTGSPSATWRAASVNWKRIRPSSRTETASGLAGGVVKGTGPAGTPPPPARGAVHSAEIEYAMGNLDSNKVYRSEEHTSELQSLRH